MNREIRICITQTERSEEFITDRTNLLLRKCKELYLKGLDDRYFSVRHITDIHERAVERPLFIELTPYDEYVEDWGDIFVISNIPYSHNLCKCPYNTKDCLCDNKFYVLTYITNRKGRVIISISYEKLLEEMTEEEYAIYVKHTE